MHTNPHIFHEPNVIQVLFIAVTCHIASVVVEHTPTLVSKAVPDVLTLAYGRRTSIEELNCIINKEVLSLTHH